MKSSILLGLLVFTGSAFAAGSKSSTQQLYQPNGGQSAASVGYKMNLPTSHDVTDNLTGVKQYDTKRTLSDWLFDYQYGIDDNQTVGADITYGSDKVDVGSSAGAGTFGATGFSDLTVDYLAKTDLGGLALYYGLTFGYNLEKRKLLTGNTTPPSVDQNRASGGMSLLPVVGILGMTGAWNYGATATYSYLFNRTVDNGSGYNVTRTGGGGLTVTPFGEYNYGYGIATLALPYVMRATSTSSSLLSTYSSRPLTYWGLELGGTYNFTEMITGIVRLGYYMYPANDNSDQYHTTTTAAYNDTQVTVGARFTF